MTRSPKIALWDVPPLYRQDDIPVQRRRPQGPVWNGGVVWQVVPVSPTERRFRIDTGSPERAGSI
jgi:hypothetical protein